LPAATTYVTPAATLLQIAMCIASPTARPQLSLGGPLEPRLMFATAMSLLGLESVRVAVTQSMPQITCEVRPDPLEPSTRTAQSLVPGATPTAPEPLLRAPMMPATCVPWPLPSLAVPLPVQSVPDTALRSGCVSAMPVSMTATFTRLASRTVLSTAAPTRRTPGGMLSPASSGTRPVARTGRSGTTSATRLSLRMCFRSVASSLAAKPRTAVPNRCVGVTPSSWAMSLVAARLAGAEAVL
jgi:hypothetical protein